MEPVDNFGPSSILGTGPLLSSPHLQGRGVALGGGLEKRRSSAVLPRTSGNRPKLWIATADPRPFHRNLGRASETGRPVERKLLSGFSTDGSAFPPRDTPSSREIQRLCTGGLPLFPHLWKVLWKHRETAASGRVPVVTDRMEDEGSGE